MCDSIIPIRNMRKTPDYSEEVFLQKQGYYSIAGIDEVGRGPIAGPVMAAAVILPVEKEFPWLHLVRDSKQLSSVKREYLYDQITRNALDYAVGSVSHEIIDAKGIKHATRLAMLLAVQQLSIPPDFLLIDAEYLPESAVPQKSLIRGDCTSLSIASASIIAKVTRDHYMMGYDYLVQNYGFIRHKGYPTKEHINNLKLFGISPIHRRSFAPVKKLLEQNPD